MTVRFLIVKVLLSVQNILGLLQDQLAEGRTELDTLVCDHVWNTRCPDCPPVHARCTNCDTFWPVFVFRYLKEIKNRTTLCPRCRRFSDGETI
jgi:hypothetical protein